MIKFWIISHLGKNPKNGGKPPKDNKLQNKKNFKIFELNNIENNWLICEILNKLNIKIIVKDKNE